MTISFDTSEQEECYRRVREHLARRGYSHSAMSDVPGFMVSLEDDEGRERTMVIEVRAWDDEPGMLVSVMSFVASDVEITPALMRALLTENYSRPMSYYSIVDNDVILLHRFGGSKLDEGRLDDSLMTVFAGASGFEQDFLRLME